MERIKMYSAPHKALRKIMSDFCGLCGKMDLNDSASLLEFKNVGQKMFLLLDEHAMTEDEFLLKALEEKDIRSSQQDKTDHARLEVMQTALLSRFLSMDQDTSEAEAYQFYLEFSLFLGKYFEHIYHEEMVTQKALWENFTDEELANIRRNFLNATQKDLKLTWYEYMFASHTSRENEYLVKTLSGLLPREEFEQLSLKMKKSMNARDYQLLFEC